MGDEIVEPLDDSLDGIKGQYIMGFADGRIEVDGQFSPAELRLIADAYERAFAAMGRTDSMGTEEDGEP